MQVTPGFLYIKQCFYVACLAGSSKKKRLKSAEEKKSQSQTPVSAGDQQVGKQAARLARVSGCTSDNMNCNTNSIVYVTRPIFLKLLDKKWTASSSYACIHEIE